MTAPPPTAPISTVVRPVAHDGDAVRFLDQRRLPREEAWLPCASAADAEEAIRTLAVRGAPLIGVAAAWGIAVEARRLAGDGAPDLRAALRGAAGRLTAARPTAVNLANAVARMLAVVEREGDGADALVRALRVEAGRIEEEDREACAAIGRHGADWLERRLPPVGGRPDRLLTHCNAGALATAGIGTALGVIRSLAARRPVAVLADETRPFWQGARLTAWELDRDGLDVTLLPDVAAAAAIASGEVAAVVVGADRIAANGDVANKVGTYGVALACRAHGVPFVVAAPTTTLDPACATGAGIPIEWRDGEEVLLLDPSGESPLRVAPEGVKALYPAFDVTPSALVDAIVTERGVSEPPHATGLARLLRG